MSKVCIAKRRTLSRSHGDSSVVLKGLPEISCIKDHLEDVISVKVPVERGAIQRSANAEMLAGESPEGIRYEVNPQDNGLLILNIYLNKIESVSLLRTAQVCQMLQVGKRAVRGLVQSGHLKSYLIGKRRRFLFTDVLEYLATSREKGDESMTDNVKAGRPVDPPHFATGVHRTVEKVSVQSLLEGAPGQTDIDFHVLATAESCSAR